MIKLTEKSKEYIYFVSPQAEMSFPKSDYRPLDSSVSTKYWINLNAFLNEVTLTNSILVHFNKNIPH